MGYKERLFSNPEEKYERESTEISAREPALSHPDVPGFIRIRNDGVMEIICDDALGMMMDPKSRSVTFVADHVKFFTKQDGGLRWNNVQFNENATSFDEPALLSVDDDGAVTDLYSGTLGFMEGDPGSVRYNPAARLSEAKRRITEGGWELE